MLMSRLSVTGPLAVLMVRVSRSSSPNSPNPAEGHCPARPPGGSATRSCPPARSKGAAHSAVGPGGPKLRAVTRSAPFRWLPRPTVSARSQRTWHRAARPRYSTADSSHPARRELLSTNSQLLDGQVRARTRPGNPPPVPRSTACPGGTVAASANARLLEIWSLTGPGPRNPRRRDSLRSAVRERASALSKPCNRNPPVFSPPPSRSCEVARPSVPLAATGGAGSTRGRVNATGLSLRLHRCCRHRLRRLAGRSRRRPRGRGRLDGRALRPGRSS